MRKLTLLAGVAAGYVLGTRAGRERYEQIKAGASRLAGNPKVQAAAGRAQEAAADAASTVADEARRRASGDPTP